jgi:calcium/calmodulin-dependent protein kinase I
VVRSRSERKHLPLELRMHSYFKLQAQHPVHVQRMESFILLHNVYAFVSPYIADTLHTAHELDDIFLIMYQLLLGLEALHKVNVIHRDIKPSNLLWDGAELTIIDYDKAAWSLPGLYHFHRMGTEAFMAPEVLRYTRDSSLKLESYTTKCDIYSAGVVFGCLLFGIRESDSLEMHVTIFREQASQLFGEALGDFLQALLQFRPGKRISASKALHHAFFNTCQSVQTYKQKSQEPPPLLVEPAN